MTDTDITMAYISIHFELYGLCKNIDSFIEEHRGKVPGSFLNLFLPFSYAKKITKELYEEMTATADKSYTTDKRLYHSSAFIDSIDKFYHYTTIGWMPADDEQTKMIMVANNERDRYKALVEKFQKLPKVGPIEPNYNVLRMFVSILGLYTLEKFSSVEHKKYLKNLKSRGKRVDVITKIIENIPQILTGMIEVFGISKEMEDYYNYIFDYYGSLDITRKLVIGQCVHSFNVNSVSYVRSINYIYGKYIKPDSK